MTYLLALAGAAGVRPTPGSEGFMQMLSDYGTVTDKFNALFTRRFRLAKMADIDEELTRWLRAAYDGAA